MIEKNFPELKEEKVFIFKTRFFKSGAMACWIFFIKFILIGKDFYKYNLLETKGIFSHELSHLERFKKMGFLSLLDLFLLDFFQ